MPDKPTRGLYDKFRVERTDGKSTPGERHDGCEYFVLDLTHDPFARPALIAYAAACGIEYPRLSEDLWRKAEAIEHADHGRGEGPHRPLRRGLPMSRKREAILVCRRRVRLLSRRPRLVKRRYSPLTIRV